MKFRKDEIWKWHCAKNFRSLFATSGTTQQSVQQGRQLHRTSWRVRSLANLHLYDCSGMPETTYICTCCQTPCKLLNIFALQLLLGCGGSPLFTLGTTYIDNHVKRDSSSMYIGFMYSMCAFGPVCGFLLGAYLLSHHVDTFSYDVSTLDYGKPPTFLQSASHPIFSILKESSACLKNEFSV